METTTQEQPQQPQGPRRLRRSRDDRVLGGVCGGLGAYFNVDPVLFRIAAVVLTVLGGAGVLAYLAMLLLVPVAADGETPAAPGAEQPNRGLIIAGVVVALVVAGPLILGVGLAAGAVLVPLAFLVAIGVLVWWMVSGEGPSGDGKEIARRAALGFGVLILCWVIAIGGAWAAAAGGETVVAVVVISAGLAVLAGAFVRPVRWLILPAVVLALSAGTVSAAGIDLDGGVGDRHYRPGSLSDLRQSYQVGAGDMEIDLRDVDLPAGDTPLRVHVGAGEARLIVPQDVCVATRAHVGIGAVTFYGRDNGGVDFEFDESPAADAKTSRLVVDGDVGAGHLQIDDDRPFDERIDRDVRQGLGQLDAGPIDAGNTACSSGG